MDFHANRNSKNSRADDPAAGRLRLAVTLGDPAGIGPEIVLRLFEQGNFPPGAAPFVVGEARHLEQARQSAGSSAPLRILERMEDLDQPGSLEAIPVFEPGDFHFEGDLVPGAVSAMCGAAAWACVRQAVALIQAGKADAVVTAPLHKESLRAAGCPYPGHTEMLSALAGGAPVAMLLVGGGLRVALATIHEPISRVPSLLSIEGILRHLRLMDHFIPWFGLPAGARPRIGVAGLNPHSGEGGMFGDEERRIIAPAIARARAEGIDAVGPVPADTAFFFHREGVYDSVLAMYHDQALIPVKTLDFHGGVNVTMGLPFIRASVDHGTGFDIVGKGAARPDSLRAALSAAATLTRNRATAANGGGR